MGPITQGGIIAAGEGRRLRDGGWLGSKAMASVAGRPLIAHALDRFRRAGIRRVTVIINESSPDCLDLLKGLDDSIDLDVIVRTTPSSFVSFQTVTDRLAPGPAVITTVDAILPEQDFRAFVEAAPALPGDAVGLGVTTYVDDESPLWVQLERPGGRISHLGGSVGSHVTAGLYVWPGQRPPQPPRSFDRLRDYLRWLVEEGLPVHGLALPRVFDVDRPRDIAQAETALVGAEESEGG